MAASDGHAQAQGVEAAVDPATLIVKPMTSAIRGARDATPTASPSTC